MTDTLYQFENYVLDVEKRRLFRDGKALKVDLRAIDLLICLVQAAPNWVGKNDLLDHLWPDQEITDWALSRLVSDTRKLLGDDGDAQRLIKTVRGRGFQFSENFKRLPSSQAVLPEDDIEEPVSPDSKSGILKYSSGVAMLLAALLFGSYVFSNYLTEKHDVTALVNLSSAKQPWLDNILENWVLSQQDMILIKSKPRDGDRGLFKQYCGGGKCSQLIAVMLRKNNHTLSLNYQVMSDGLKEEERELISSRQPFLIFTLRDVVASTMNRSSDYFPLPSAIFMAYPDHVYQDMYLMHINLENTYVSFQAQQRRRNELVQSITKRLGIKREQQYEEFFVTHFDQMTKEERFIFDQMRAMTSGTLYQCNRHMLTLLESNPALIREIPKLEAVRKHLAFWINKYHNIFMGRQDMSLLYVGVEDGVPFPSGIDDQVSTWLKSHEKNLSH